MSIFSHVKARKPQTNTFDLSHDRKFSLDMGLLVPILSLECVPGDKIQMSTSQLLRFAPMLAPVMHQISVYTHFYFVPNRILWVNWEKFITGGEDGDDTSVHPYIKLSTIDIGTQGDYFGIPTDMGAEEEISPLPFYAYNKIYNEFYRDQNLIDKKPDVAINGDNFTQGIGTQINKAPFRRAWQHDYFTSALPWTQKGAEATIPLGTSATVDYVASGVGSLSKDPSTGLLLDAGTGADLQSDLSTGIIEIDDYTGSTDQPVDVDNTNALSVDLSSATAATINDLRNAFRLQEWLEKNARGGSRYIESILSHFGVKSSDARLQRPEFLGGGSSPVTISEVLQTSNADTQDTPQGNMAGHGVTAGASNSFSYFAEEHGYIIGIMSVMPKTAYSQGIAKHWQKFDKFDYFWPSFAHLGEQPIVNKELYVSNIPADNLATFGYTPRYSEYKYMNSSVHGEFRTTLDFWELSRKFSGTPLLNQIFIDCKPDDRIFAVLDEEKMYCHMYHRIKAQRRMPYFGTPTL